MNHTESDLDNQFQLFRIGIKLILGIWINTHICVYYIYNLLQVSVLHWETLTWKTVYSALFCKFLIYLKFFFITYITQNSSSIFTKYVFYWSRFLDATFLLLLEENYSEVVLPEYNHWVLHPPLDRMENVCEIQFFHRFWLDFLSGLWLDHSKTWILSIPSNL